MATLTMVRIACCEAYKCGGDRCSICPNRPENKESVRRYLEELSSAPLGRRLGTRNFAVQSNTREVDRWSATHSSDSR